VIGCRLSESQKSENLKSKIQNPKSPQAPPSQRLHLALRYLQASISGMKELIFEVTEDPFGGYVATALGVGIHTQGDGLEDLRNQIRDAVACYYDGDDDGPSLIRLHFVRDEVLAV